MIIIIIIDIIIIIIILLLLLLLLLLYNGVPRKTTDYPQPSPMPRVGSW